MKNIVLISFFLFFGANCLLAQTNSFPPDGNAGVGTSTPATWYFDINYTSSIAIKNCGK